MEEVGRGTTSNSIQTHHFEGCLQLVDELLNHSVNSVLVTQ